MKKDELWYYLKLAEVELYYRDLYLIQQCVHERTIVHRFAHYLENILVKNKKLKGFNIDCEYNRNLDGPKRIDVNGTDNYPDMIIHKRGEYDYDLLIAEFKTHWNNDNQTDINKIKEFMESKIYKYQYGVSIIFYENGAEYHWIEI